MELKEYSEKSFAVYGNTKEYKDKLKELGGKWNSKLRDGPGWIFANKGKETVQKWLNTLKEIKEEITVKICLKTYSEKSFVVYGEDTKEYKEKIKELGGKWNSNLKDGPGWIFANKSRDKVEEWMKTFVKKEDEIVVTNEEEEYVEEEEKEDEEYVEDEEGEEDEEYVEGEEEGEEGEEDEEYVEDEEEYDEDEDEEEGDVEDEEEEE